MTSLPLKQHEPAPDFAVTSVRSKPLTLRNYSFQQDLLLVALHGPNCPFCAEIAAELAAHSDDWESWGVELLALLSDPGPAFNAPFEQGRDVDGVVRLRYSGAVSDVAFAVVERHGRFMEGWSLRHPEAVDWHEVAETVRWVATQDHDCPSCEVLPGYDEVETP